MIDDPQLDAANATMRLVNLTPHRISIRVASDEVDVEPSGVVARVEVTTTPLKSLVVDGVHVPAFFTSYENVINVPPPEADTVYLVSSPVAANSTRTDLCVPFDLQRDDEGNVVFCRGVAFVHQTNEEAR